MKVLIATAHDAGYRSLADITLPTVQRYAEKHGYELFYDGERVEEEKDACKAAIFFRAYDSGKFGPDDLFMWIDTDAIIANPDIRVEDIWAKYADPETHFLWSFNWDGPNSGVYLARISAQARNFINVYMIEQLAMGWGDQNAMNQKSLYRPFRDWVKCIPGKVMNAAPYEEYGLQNEPNKNELNNYEPGDWIVHLPGMEASRRAMLLSKYAQAYTGADTPPGRSSGGDLMYTPPVRTGSAQWPILRGVAEALQKQPRGLHDCVDWALWHAVYENNEYEIGTFEPADFVLDLGASTGPFSALAYARGSRYIRAFEMDAGSFAVMDRNLAFLTPQPGEIEIYQAAVVGLEPVKPLSYIPDSMRLNMTDEGERVRHVLFDDIVSCVNVVRFLKIDIEGAEWDIFYNTKQLYKIQEIAGEYHPDMNQTHNPETLEEFLRLNGFKTKFIVKDGIGDFRAWR